MPWQSVFPLIVSLLPFFFGCFPSGAFAAALLLSLFNIIIVVVEVERRRAVENVRIPRFSAHFPVENRCG
jgi:hypothetical protein